MDLSAQCCLCKGDRSSRINIHILSLEDRMTFYLNFNQQIPSWAAVYTRFTLFTNTGCSVRCQYRPGSSLRSSCGFSDVTASMAVRTFLSLRSLPLPLQSGQVCTFLTVPNRGQLCIYDLTFYRRISDKSPDWFLVLHLFHGRLYTSSFRFRISCFSHPNTASSKVIPYRCPDISTFHRSICLHVCCDRLERSPKISPKISPISPPLKSKPPESGTLRCPFQTQHVPD